jgi:adenine-specific DNA-methyltransferase
MPTLNWIGKQAVVEHHKQVPFHLLRSDPERSVGDPDSGNLLVEGDNLLALKALLPYYAGQVKCIYIDPPYNTGNENWVYNDAVNSPEMRAWLGKVVGRQAEDLARRRRRALRTARRAARLLRETFGAQRVLRFGSLAEPLMTRFSASSGNGKVMSASSVAIVFS